MEGIRLHGQWLAAAEFLDDKVVLRLTAMGVPRAVQSFLMAWFRQNGPVPAQTSGSTGTPKTIYLQREQLVASAQLTALHFGFRSGQAALLPLSADFIAGKMMLVRAMVSGLDLYTAEPSQRPDLLFPDVAFSFCPLVPAQLYAMLQAGADPSRLGTLLLGGSDLPVDLQPLLRQLGKQQVWQGFGMTETVSHLALRQLHPLSETHYTPLPGILLGQDERACLRVWGAITAYHWLQTNDVVALNPDQSFSWWGRADFVLMSGGHKVHPEQLEQRLRQLASEMPELVALSRSDFYVAGRAHPQYGQVVGLVTDAAPGSWPDLAILQELLRPQLPSAQLPRFVEFKAQLERTANGKVKRHMAGTN
ncbi:MAG: AMP-binding protein [Bacteroidia bacterium]